jgi:hypothetical protein
MQTFFQNGDEQVNRDGAPDLGADRVRAHCCPANGGLIFCNTAGSLWLYIGEDVFD